MGCLIDGEWRSEPLPTGSGGEFVRPRSVFRERVHGHQHASFPATPGRYHLYVARACPWSHRTLLYLTLKRLENLISVTFAEPEMLENGWTFAHPDAVTGVRHVYELYQQSDPLYTGRATVPVLWDKQTHTIVNNESGDIIRMMNREFDDITHELTDFYPDALAAEIDEVNDRVYETINNGVYRAGFATSQKAYDTAVQALFASLDWIEGRLQHSRYLLGDLLTEADLRLFPTLIRFDTVYYGHFKCNLRHVYEYPALWAYTRDLYQMPGIADTVALGEYKAHYYGSHRQINPTGIVPVGPVLDLNAPAGRGTRPASAD